MFVSNQLRANRNVDKPRQLFGLRKRVRHGACVAAAIGKFTLDDDAKRYYAMAQELFTKIGNVIEVQKIDQILNV